MKICPLVTQASLLEDLEKGLLIGESDNTELHAAENEAPGEQEEKNEPLEDEDENGEEIFLNPEASGREDEDDEGDGGGAGEGAASEDAECSCGEGDPAAGEKEIRFIAKSYKGEVKCLGTVCRFHDDEKGECRFDRLLASAEAEAKDDSEQLESLKEAVDRAWDFQQKSTGDTLQFFREMSEKSEKSREELLASFDEKLKEIKDMLSGMNDDNKLVTESIADTLAEMNGQIEERFKSGDERISEFRTEVSGWKDSLDQNVETLRKGLDDSKKMVEELSENNSQVMKAVESQKESLAREERRRELGEAKKLNNSGVMCYHNGQYEKALGMFRKAVEIDDGFTEAYNNLGLTYTEMNEEEKATEAFKKAIELNPSLGATYNNLGYAFYRMGSYTEAVEMYNEAIGRSKDNGSAWTNLGNAYYKMDRVEEAIEAWNRAVEIDPSNDKARRNLKRFHAEAGEKK